jgi:hypothetical protein
MFDNLRAVDVMYERKDIIEALAEEGCAISWLPAEAQTGGYATASQPQGGGSEGFKSEYKMST